ncbi:phosphotransferase [Streptomyces sp. NPDC088400]|uniref:phosphotransferase n=1 Tax=Streptomyces sp. NPDC088400 TaxID=3365861 RepID=UPI00381465F6
MNRNAPGPEFWSLLHPHTGDVTDFRPTPRGFSSDVAALIECEKGRFFVKAVRNRPGGRRDSIIRERLINPAACPISPTLKWHSEDDTWHVLGFDWVDGRGSDFAPGSPDLPAIVDTLNRIGEVDLPEMARDWLETRWNRFATDDADASLLQGEALLYTDINPSNLIIGDQNTWAVDWSWPTRGAAFIDPACLVVQLISAGHSAERAESWASGCAAWTDADPKAIDAFAAATLRMHRAFAERKPDASWLRAIAEAARSWASYRGVTV